MSFIYYKLALLLGCKMSLTYFQIIAAELHHFNSEDLVLLFFHCSGFQIQGSRV